MFLEKRPVQESGIASPSSLSGRNDRGTCTAAKENAVMRQPRVLAMRCNIECEIGCNRWRRKGLSHVGQAQYTHELSVQKVGIVPSSPFTLISQAGRREDELRAQSLPDFDSHAKRRFASR